jgi:hypothetical protein
MKIVLFVMGGDVIRKMRLHCQLWSAPSAQSWAVPEIRHDAACCLALYTLQVWVRA